MASTTPYAGRGTAVLIPCYNEALTIGKVVADFRQQLPEATVYVFNNNSSDGTGERAAEAGAIVIREKRQGKGAVVASMLTKVDADYYVMVDGDDTYPAESVRALLGPVVSEDADMVVGQRLSDHTTDSFRRFHVFGNRLVRKVINVIFGSQLMDVMSGYRAFNREVAEDLPVVAFGFDVETEMTLQLLCRGYVIQEIPIPYRERHEGSSSKLRTFRDGALVLFKILGIFKAYKPLTCFGGMAILFGLAAMPVAYAMVLEYMAYGHLQSATKAIVAVALILLASMSATVGVTLHTVNFRIFEMVNVLSKQLHRLDRRQRKSSP